MKKHPYAFLLCYLLMTSSWAQMTIADSLIGQLEQQTTPSERIDLLYELGNHLLYSNPEKTDSILLEVDDLLKTVNYPVGQLKMITLHAFLLANAGENEQAIDLAKQGIELAKELEIPLFERNNHQVLTTVYNRIFDSEKAMESAYQALELSKTLGDQRGIAVAYYQLGNITWQILDNEKAKQYYLQAKDILEALGDKDYLGNIYNNLTNVIDSVELQMDYAQKALAIFEETGHTHGIAFANNSLGSIYHDDPKNRDLDKALEHYLISAEIWEKMHYVYGLLSIYGNIGSIYAERGQLDQALPYLDKAMQMARETGAEEEISDLFYYYFLAYATSENFEKAKASVDSFIANRDRVFSSERSATVAEAETKYQTEQTEKELAQKQLELEKAQNTRKNLLIGAITALLLLTGLFQYFRNRQRIRQKEAELALQLERTEAEKLRELDQLKSNFFANISHEFRTPLTLILSPLQQMIEGKFKADYQKYFRIMERNGRRLLHLVNQLLELSRLESGRTQLQVSQGDLSAFIRAIAFSFESMAIRQQINMVVEGADTPLEAWFDADKLEKILTNLLSNAYKFTPEEGTVSTSLKQIEKKEVIIEIKDNGIGIAKEQLPHIFDRFYSVGNSETEMTGTGIGLALTKELVELHHGHIEVESREGAGSRFRIRLPILPEVYSDDEKAPDNIRLDETAIDELALGTVKKPLQDIVSIPQDSKNPLVLIVEDNPDVRTYIKDQLVDNFQILEAKHGKEGLDLATKKMPDLIVTDLMMPEMDGVALCRHLKTDSRTSHIPIIMLTAKAEREDKLEGLQTGADDYLIKPFDAEELRVRINNLIEQRRLLRKRFDQETVFKPKEMAVTPVDEAFLKQVLSSIENNMEEETFSVVELSKVVNMSRSQLHRKLKALSGKSPNQIIREMRLQRGKELLEKGAGNASEVAFMVGFSSLAYFSKCFKDQFGVSPSGV